MTLVLLLRFMLVLVAMLAAGTIGFIIARNQAERRTAMQISMLSSEINKMRRRTSYAASETERARSSLSQEPHCHKKNAGTAAGNGPARFD